jgi:hypothetical protein
MALAARDEWARTMPSTVERLVRDKFRRHTSLREKLVKTGDRPFNARGQHSSLLRALAAVRPQRPEPPAAHECSASRAGVGA